LVVNKAATPKKQIAIPPVALVIGAVCLAGLALFVYIDRASKRPPEAPPPLTGPAKDYVRNLRFVSADGQSAESPKMEAHESYLKQSVVEITGNIQNTGDRVLDLVEINCVFYDAYGQVILRERVPIVSKKMGKLAPRETKAFRLAFDNVPEAWNQVMPSMIIARIDFS
jgi:Protein of unknown function (DUF3426)